MRGQELIAHLTTIGPDDQVKVLVVNEISGEGTWYHIESFDRLEFHDPEGPTVVGALKITQ